MRPISLILLVHQEADVIEQVVEDFWRKVISKIPGSEFIICEDGSTDGTKEILLRMQERCTLTLHMGNERRGYTRALASALALAHHDIIFFSDSDGQHNPDDFWKMIEGVDSRAMIIGWKKNRRDGVARGLMSKVFNRMVALWFGLPLHDANCGFRLIGRDVVDSLLQEQWLLKHCIGSELAVRAHQAGFRVGEVAVSHAPRQFGSSRGLPFQKLPQIVFHVVRGMYILKQSARRPR